MPEIINVQLGPNRVTQGFYKIEDGELIMTYADGEPVVSDLGRQFRHVLREGDNARAIAAVLTKEIRAVLSDEQVPGFNDTLEYQNLGVA